MTNVKELLMGFVDSAVAITPQPQPSPEKFRSCRLIAHRGAHQRRNDLENTLEAFSNAVESGATGIEFDVRWTVDDVAVIHHDADTRRSSGKNLVIAEVPFEKLRHEIPKIPTLDEVIRKFGGKTHLMIEIKKAENALSARHIQELETLLKPFRATEDFHIMSLSFELLRACEFVPRQALLSIAEFNVAKLSRHTLEEKFGGFTGHYLLISDETIRRHHDAGQVVGTGFAASRSSLYRELNRNVDWIFTNHIVERVGDRALNSERPTE